MTCKNCYIRQTSTSVGFQGSAGISIDNLPKIIEHYLESHVVRFEDELLIQREGVCIGSSLAPLLTETYLNSMDSALATYTNSLESGELLICRYVDDTLMCAVDKECLLSGKKVSVNSSPELVFTVKHPSNGVLQYLDLKLLRSSGLCWRYGKKY